jgi:hypothetical protein
MRVNDIKFRGLYEVTGKMLCGSLTVEYDGTFHINWWESVLIEPENNYYEPHPFFEVVKPETVGQFLMIKYKNEQDVYSGDVVNYKGKRYIVVSDGWKCRLERSMMWANENINHIIDEDVIFESELIGNVNQNPELLCK